jgi:hypothetical protein
MLIAGTLRARYHASEVRILLANRLRKQRFLQFALFTARRFLHPPFLLGLLPLAFS